MKKLSLLFILTLLSSCLNAQIWNGNYTINSQAGADNFAVECGCTEIEGWLLISNLENLDGLSNLVSIGGSLGIVNNASLENLAGLSNLISVGGGLDIVDNANLENIDGLSNLTSLDGIYMLDNISLKNLNGLSNVDFVNSDMYISDNVVLENLDGFSSLSSIGGSLTIRDNGGLENLDGLSNLSSIDKSLTIRDNSILKNLDGLSSLSYIGFDANIANNDGLENLDGLSNLTTTGLSLDVNNNNNLENLNGLSSLTTVGGDLYIRSNDKLENLDGLSNLSSVLRFFYISGNYNLKNIDALSGFESIGFSIYIHNNTNLENLAGLSNLTSVRSLGIRGCPKLENLNYLSNLNRIGWELEIGNMSNLENIDGLSNVDYMGWSVNIHDNERLENLNGLSKLDTINGSLSIIKNDRLENLEGLSNISFIKWNLDIDNNDNLTSLEGLSSLKILSNLYIDNNIKLENLNGLSNLDSIEVYLGISDNDILTNIDGLSNLKSIGLVDSDFVEHRLEISYNENLHLCCLVNCWINEEIINGSVLIENNGTECNSVEELQEECDSDCEMKELSPNFITTGNCALAEINFMDVSEALNTEITTWDWDFGDGNISIDQNPTNIYAVVGNYTVTLTVSDGNIIETYTTEICLNDYIVPNFELTTGIYEVGDLVETMNTTPVFNSCPVNEFVPEWSVTGGGAGFEFVEGTGVNSENANLIFSEPGEYDVSLTYVGVCSNTETISITIIDIGSGIVEESISDNLLKVYPNPTTDLVNVVYELNKPKEVKIILTDLHGKEVSQFYVGQSNQGINAFEFHTLDYANGLYFVQIYADEILLKTEKLLVNHL